MVIYPPITAITSTHVSTAAAAHYINRAPQTLRKWHCLGQGPLRPQTINGRLAWPVADIKKLVGVPA